MSEPAPYELYRVITDYEALQDGFLDRIEDLDTTLEEIEQAGELSPRNLQKLLTRNPGKRVQQPRNHRFKSARRTFGWETLGKTLKGTGLALVLVVDDERFAPIKQQLGKRKRPRQPANGGSAKPTWLFTKKKAREMGKRRFSLMSDLERKRHQKKAGKASGRARRLKAQLAGALLPTKLLTSCAHGQPTPITRTDCSAPMGDQAPLRP